MIQFKKLNEEAIIPTKGHKEDSGWDLKILETTMLKPFETKVIPTGIAINLPEGYEAQVRPRSGVTSKTKLRVQLGTVDNGYHGDIGVIVDNIGGTTVALDKGYKLAQLVVAPVSFMESEEVLEFSNKTERGTNGFGSTGV